jgi:D-alanine transfer protein
MFKKVILFHIIPILISIALSAALIYTLVLFSAKADTSVVKEGTQKKLNGYYANLIEGEQAEIDFYSSLKNDKQLTIFGSSEFSGSPYCPFNFFPDTLGIPAMGLGHAFHQSFSILSELLAADEYIENSKICIILSLGWFATEGTNTSAFIEFVRPNFLNNIIQNKSINLEYKKHIGAYVQNHQNELDGISNNMEILKDINTSESKNPLIYYKSKLRQYLKKIAQRETVKYSLTLGSLESKKWNGDFSSRATELQKDFESKITNNKLRVNDEYYTNHILDKDGKEKTGVIPDIDLKNNKELNDFFLLVKYLKSKNANCSFIIQPMNPYFYSNLENYDALIKVLTSKLDEHKIPYLNMHVKAKSKYEPGILNDVMHLGDYGWMKINSFLKKTYYAD